MIRFEKQVSKDISKVCLKILATICGIGLATFLAIGGLVTGIIFLISKFF